MGYSNKFVMCLLINGTIQKELANGEVHIQYNVDYTLRFRNRHNRRAVVKIYIDGENVSGNGYVIPANDKVDIKRHSHKDRAFRFVSLDSAEAAEFGKNSNEDKSKGVIEARFYLEKAKPKVEHIHHYYPQPYPVPYPPRTLPPYWYGTRQINTLEDGHKTVTQGVTFNGDPTGSMMGGATLGAAKSACSAPVRANLRARETVSEGCTVEGGVSGQRFGTTHISTEDHYTSVMLVLKGYHGAVAQPVHTNDDMPSAVVTENDAPVANKFCTNCGRKSRSADKFCGNCGNRVAQE